MLWLSCALAAEPQVGDLVFHESTSSQAGFLKAATGSRYTHVGIVVLGEGEPLVVEAVQPTRRTPLGAWIDRGVDDHLVVMRPRRPLSEEEVQALTAYTEQALGTDYDLRFHRSDDQLYCSELVYKAYAAAGIELVELKRFSDYDLSHPSVQKAIRERYGATFDSSFVVIGPADLMDSELLVRVEYTD